jgi:hypothetical protein
MTAGVQIHEGDTMQAGKTTWRKASVAQVRLVTCRQGR